MFDSSKRSFISCNYVQATEKIKITVARPPPSVGREDPLERNVIPMDPEGGMRDKKEGHYSSS